MLDVGRELSSQGHIEDCAVPECYRCAACPAVVVGELDAVAVRFFERWVAAEGFGYFVGRD